MSRLTALFKHLSSPGMLPGLHAVRGMAALAIVAFHLSPVGEVKLPEQLQFVWKYFGSSVIAFFVLSGFSLFWSTVPRLRNGTWVRDFFVRRFFRIAPLYYLMLAVYVYRFGMGSGVSEVLLNVGFLFGVFPGLHQGLVWAGWAVGIEAVFYVLVPVILAMVTKPKHGFMLFIFTVFVSWSARTHFAEEQGYPDNFGYMNFLTHSVAFVVGIGAYYLFRETRNPQGKITPIVCFASFVGLMWVYGNGGWALAGTAFTAFVVPVVALAYGMLVLSQLFGPWRLLTNRITVVLGEFSYSIYLLHPFVIYHMKHVYDGVEKNAEPIPAFITCLALTYLVLIPLSFLSYVLIERSGISLGAKLLKRSKGEQTATA